MKNFKDLSIEERRRFIEKTLRITLPHIGANILEAAHCENMIGAGQIPIGVAGPVNGKYIPLATTEGALVASVNRGCKAITESGGARVMGVRVGATRGPVFKVKSISENPTFYRYVVSHIKKFDEIAKTTSWHIALTDVKVSGVGLYVYVRFVFDTQDAMGLNMVTIATEKIVDFIEKQTR